MISPHRLSPAPSCSPSVSQLEPSSGCLSTEWPWSEWLQRCLGRGRTAAALQSELQMTINVKVRTMRDGPANFEKGWEESQRTFDSADVYYMHNHCLWFYHINISIFKKYTQKMWLFMQSDEVCPGVNSMLLHLFSYPLIHEEAEYKNTNDH